jgi:glucose-1-phosphate thymidylyltransferase
MRLKGLVIAKTHPVIGTASCEEQVTAAREVANRPIICHVIDSLSATGVDEVGILGTSDTLATLSKLSDETLRRAKYIATAEPEHLVESFADALPFVGGAACLVHVADGLPGRALPSVERYAREDTPDVSFFVHAQRASRPLMSEQLTRLLGLDDDPYAATRLGMAGLGVFGPGAIERASVGSLGQSHDIDEELVAISERIAAGGGRISVTRLPSWRCYTGDPNDLIEINRMVLDRVIPEGDTDVGMNNRIEGRVEIHPTARVEDSVINGPAVIGEGSEIVDAYVGPYTSIGRHVTLRGAEIERSIVADHALIENIGVRIERSTIGHGARISRDFGLPRAMRMHVGADIELKLD